MAQTNVRVPSGRAPKPARKHVRSRGAVEAKSPNKLESGSTPSNAVAGPDTEHISSSDSNDVRPCFLNGSGLVSLPPSRRSTSTSPPAASAAAAEPSRATTNTCPSKGRRLVAQGITFRARSLDEYPNAPIIGAKRPRDRSSRLTSSDEAEISRQKEEDWQKQRKAVLDREFFNRLASSEYGPAKYDFERGWLFEGSPLPDWLRVERETQEDGVLGTFKVRPSLKDIENRFPEILRVLEPIGMVLGITKIDMREWLERPKPSPDPNSDVQPPAKCRKISQNEKLRVDGLIQTLPLHPSSNNEAAPVFKLTSIQEILDSVSRYARDIGKPYKPITEEEMLCRGRTWKQIMARQAGKKTRYSSDNDISEDLRVHFNIGDPQLDRLKGNIILKSDEPGVAGIHTPYLYIGNAMTMFAAHQEDYSALSLNIHHRGAPKVWRVTCPLDYRKVERIAERLDGLGGRDYKCSQHVRHSSLMLSLGCLEEAGVRSLLVKQHPGEMMVTWPMAYHQGFNEGANVCEAIAYGTSMWHEGFIKNGGEQVYRKCNKNCGGGGNIITLTFSNYEAERNGKSGRGTNGGTRGSAERAQRPSESEIHGSNIISAETNESVVAEAQDYSAGQTDIYEDKHDGAMTIYEERDDGDDSDHGLLL